MTYRNPFYHLEYYKLNKSHIKERQKKYYLENKEHIIAQVKQYQKKARKKKNIVSNPVTNDDFDEMFKDGICICLF